MRKRDKRRILPLVASLFALVLLVGACSTEIPTAPLQQPSGPVTLPSAEPVASFEVVESSEGSLLVMFNNLSTNAASYLWDFGDGQTSAGVSPIHRYAKGGTYTVKLTAFNGNLSDTDTQFVTVGEELPGPSAGFTANTETDSLKVVFLNTSTPTDPKPSFTWDFGDGTGSSETHPTHTYKSAGTYVVSLTARNGSGSSTVAQAVTVPPNVGEGEGEGEGG